MNLLMIPKNVDFKIVKIKQNKLSDKNQYKHLENLGFVVGAVINVVSENGGNLIVKIKDSRVAIGRDIASAIIVGGI